MPFHPRRNTVTAMVGPVAVGSCHPIVVQSMTNTDTADVEATVQQVAALARAGSELVRVTVNNEEAAQAVPAIAEGLDRIGVAVPVVGDFHYNGHLLLTKYPDCARALAKYRINPGNVGGKRRDEHFRAIVEVAVANDKPVRIGVNWGSLDQQLLTELMDANHARPEPKDAREVTLDAMVESAIRSAELAEATGLGHDRIILSAKVSAVQDLVDVYRLLAARGDYPLHLGLTEAGLGTKGIVASTAALGILLEEGIGDTIRVSLTPGARGDRTEEVQVAQQILQSLGLRSFTPQVTSCPGCGRTTSTFFQAMAQDIERYLREQMPVWRASRPGVEGLRVAVMGCVVNGPGESKHADIGISLPGTAEDPRAPVYVDGKLRVTLSGERIVPEFLAILDAYVEGRYAAAEPAARASRWGAGAGVLALLLGTPLAAQGPGVGDPAPVPTVHDLEGVPVDLGQWIGRRPVYLEFWATWCTSCAALEPAVRAARAAYGSEVEFIGINVTLGDSRDSVRAWVTAHQPPWRTLYDDEGASQRAYDVAATSYVVIIDRTGRIAYTGVGGSQALDPPLRRVSQE